MEKVNSESMKKSQFSNDLVQNYISENSLRLHPMQEKLIKVTMGVPRAVMMGAADEIQFIQNLLRLIKAKRCIDIGVFTGYSALSWALVIPDDGKVIACDIDDKIPNQIAVPLWKEAGMNDKIDLRIAPAKDTLQQLIDENGVESYDFAFIDADSEGEDDYYELCLKLVRSGGIICLDNMLRKGQVADKDIQDSRIDLKRKLNKKIHNDRRVHSSLLRLGDGTNFVFKI